MKNPRESDDQKLREALRELAEAGVPSADVRASVLRKQQTASMPAKRRMPPMARWAMVAGFAVVVLMAAALLPRLARNGSSSLAPTPTVSAVEMPRIVQTSNEIGRYVLSTTLPASPGSVPMFRQMPLQPPTLEEARRIAAQFGMQGQVFTNTYRSELIANDASVPAFLIVDGPRRLSVDPDYIRYSDSRVRLSSWSLQRSPTFQAIPQQQLVDAALSFMLPFVGSGGQTLKLVPSDQKHVLTVASVLSGTSVATIYGDIGMTLRIGMSGTQAAVGEATMSRSMFQPADATVNIVDAMTAYARLAAGTHKLGYRKDSDAAMRANPTWTQQYRAGQWASIEGSPQLLMPLAEMGQPAPQPRVEIKGIRLDLSALPFTPTLSEPVWAAGMMEAMPDGELILRVEQWERGGMPTGTGMTGTLDISGTVDATSGAPFALLRRPDGETFFLPNAPDDLTNGIVVGGFLRPTDRWVNGYRVAAWEQLEQQDAQPLTPAATLQVQSQPAPAVQSTAVLAVVETPATGDTAAPAAVSAQVWPQGGSSDVSAPPVNADGSIDGVEGWLQATLVQDEQGKLKRVEAFLSSVPLTGTRWFAVLSGPLDVLSDLAQRDGTRVRVWGRALSAEAGNTARIEITRYERADLTQDVRAWLGRVVTATVDAQTVMLLEDQSGESFVLATSLLSPQSIPMMSDVLNRWFVVEGVLWSERWDGMRVIQDQGMTASSGQTSDLQAYHIFRPQVIQEQTSSEVGNIERAELIYLAQSLSRRLLPDGTLSIPDQIALDVAPAWRFSGHTNAGNIFEVIVDARATPAQNR